jgi:GNAT superfamily N-acetyltransferase
MAEYSTRPLDAGTWPDFARLVEAHDGVFGGCWCMSFHPEGVGRDRSAAQNRADKELRVRDGRAHAALVYELPDWRITCFFVDRARRRDGVATVALAGALDEIARLGGGTVESYPDDIGDRAWATFLHNGTVAMFEQQGFERTRRIGKNRWVVRKVVG